jgi:DNA-binding GntR family transcriptional regulator
MKAELVEIYSDASNLAVMRHPGRRFPGSLIQGDSLFILVDEARQLYDAVKNSGDEEIVALAEMHKNNLEDRLAEYERAMVQHGISLPYRGQ